MEEFKYWKCPECGYVVTDLTWSSIKFEPKCRCYGKTGKKWGDYRPIRELAD